MAIIIDKDVDKIKKSCILWLDCFKMNNYRGQQCDSSHVKREWAYPWLNNPHPLKCDHVVYEEFLSDIVSRE